MLSLQERIEVLVDLGQYLQLKDERLQAFMKRTEFNNKWFKFNQQEFAINAICQEFLNRQKLEKWVSEHEIVAHNEMKNVGIIPNNSIPLSAFHDMLCVFIQGHHATIKLPENDLYLLPFLVKKMDEIKSGVQDYFSFPHRLPIKKTDAILTSADDNLTKHFTTYFKDIKHLIRTKKKSVAVISGNESDDNLKDLATDTLTYFGNGSRNVSKLFVPESYDFNQFLEVFHEFKDIIRVDVYKNNYDHQISLLILDRVLHWNNGSIILAKNKELFSPISVLNFEHYNDDNDLNQKTNQHGNNIHRLVSNHLDNSISFGKSLFPTLNDYENDKNVMQFLNNI